MEYLRGFMVVCLGLMCFPNAFCKEPLNITCTLDPMQITVEIFTTRPLFNVQLKNSDKLICEVASCLSDAKTAGLSRLDIKFWPCDPQDFTANSIKFTIQNYQIGMCGFVRSESSTNGMDGTFWNNLIWKEKPTSKTTKTTKIKCTQKLSTIFGGHGSGGVMSMPIRVQVIHLPFGAFPSAFGGDGIPQMPPSDPTGMGASSMPPGMMSPFPPGIGLNSGMIMSLRSGQLPFGGLSLGGPSASPSVKELSGLEPDSTISMRPGGFQLPIIRRRK